HFRSAHRHPGDMFLRRIHAGPFLCADVLRFVSRSGDISIRVSPPFICCYRRRPGVLQQNLATMQRSRHLGGTAFASRTRHGVDERPTHPAITADQETATMYHVSVYCIGLRLWRWEIRVGHVLLRCGTAFTEAAAQDAVRHLANA